MYVDVITELLDDILRLETTIKSRDDALNVALLSEPDSVTEAELLERYSDEMERIKKQRFVLEKKRKVYNQALLDYQAAYYKAQALKIDALNPRPKVDDYSNIGQFSRGQRKQAAYFDKEQFRTKWLIHNKEQFDY